MHFKNLLPTAVSLACLSATIATATDLDIVAPPTHNSDIIQSGWSTLDIRQEPAQPPSSDPNAPRLVQIVRVSDDNGTLKFFPDKVRGNVSDIIQFHFYPKNHTITEGLFTQPCMPLPAANATETRPGQKSGFQPVTPDAQFRPIYNLVLNDTKPMWIFCGQTPHCQKGMVMVINQNETDTVKTLENYRAAAMALPVPAAPGAPAGSSSAVYGAPPPPAGTQPPPPPASAPPAATATSAAGLTTVTPAGNSGPSLVGSPTGTGTASASIAAFTGGASQDLQAWGSTWSVGLLGLAGIGMWW